MEIAEDQPLQNYSTMRLGGQAAYLTHVKSQSDLIEAWHWAKDKSLPVVVIGGGSNIVWSDEGFQGLVIVNDIGGYQVATNPNGATVTIGAGENWDGVVKRTVEAGLSGIEALSLIPGKAGATPIQNVGAYGQEISDSLKEVIAYDTKIDKIVSLAKPDCHFGYRTSRFKTTDKGRFLIIEIILELTHSRPKPPYYSAVKTYFNQHRIESAAPNDLRKAVIDIRTAKLPDPKEVANCGSFFANPIVSQSKYEELRRDSQEEVPHWPTDDQVKLSAAWLIEQVGLKDNHDPATGMATWSTQPLVFVNESARSSADLFRFKEMVVDKVNQRFGIVLVQEPETMPSR